MPYIIALLVVVVLIIFYFIKLQRQFVNIGELKSNALSTIGVQQQSRWDALTELAKATKAYAGHERNSLIEIIQNRQPGVRRDAQSIQADDNLWARAMGSLNAVVESYPDLKASTLYQNLMTSINDYETRVRVSRMSYNDMVTKWNRLVKQFPSSIVASMLHHTPDIYLETPAEKTEMPNLEY